MPHITRKCAAAITVGCALALHTAIAMAAGAPGPGKGNPLDSLPVPQPVQPSTVQVDIVKKDAEPALQRLLDTHITPSRFQISGVHALPFELIAAEFAPMANREVTIAELLKAADKVTRLYQARGYPLSFAFLPTQKFENRVVVVNVVEGYVGSIEVTGNPGRAKRRLLRIAEQLKDERPLRRDTFERVSAILAMQPGVHIVASVQPPARTDGAGAMTLAVKRRPVTTGLGIDRATARLRGVVSVSENGLTPLGEQITLSALAPPGPQHEHYYGVTYAQPLGTRGTIFQLNFSDYKTRPEYPALAAVQFQPSYRTHTKRIAATLSHPFILDGRRNLTLAGGVYAADNHSTYTRSVPAPDPVVTIGSGIRALSAEFNWRTFSEKNSTNASGGIYHGIDGLGAGLDNSIADLGFTRVKATLIHTRQLPNRFGVTLAASGQYSDSVLPLSEQITFGASQFGLAYPASEITSDRGWGWSLELNRSWAPAMPYLKQVQPYLMTDASHVRGKTGDVTHRNIASIGVGIRFGAAPRYSLDLSIAQPVGETPTNASRRSPRLNLTYFYQFE